MKRFGLLLVAFGSAAVLAACQAVGAEEGRIPEQPPEGDVVTLVVDAASGTLLKAYPRALYESRDGGRTWNAVPVPVAVRGGRIHAVAVPRHASETLYLAGEGFGVLRSTDRGRTWRRLGEGLPSLDVVALTVNAKVEQTVYVLVRDQGLYRSEDAGSSWKRMDAGPGGAVRQLVHSDLPGSMNTGWLYAATSDGVYRAMDCFCGWHETGPFPEHVARVQTVTYNPREPKHVYASTAGGVFRSSDAGESWQQVSPKSPEEAFVAFDSVSGALYALAREGTLLRSEDRGASWEAIGS